MKKILTAALIVFIANQAIQAQDTLQVSNSLTPEQMVEMILGPGVTATNVVYTGMDIARGEFWGGPGNIGIEEGIILTTGDVNIAPGPNTTASASYNNGGGSDPDLEIHAGSSIMDASILEFDFVPSSAEISFNYVFASEEYHEYAGAYFNDVFGFFLSGPGIDGSFTDNAENIALVPGSMTYVTINSVNNGPQNMGPCENCQYFIHNTMDFTQYDAFTTVLSAIFPVQAGETYHLKLAIGDAADAIYDTGVFIEAGSFSSTAVGVNEEVVEKPIRFYPNPVRDKLTLTTKESVEIQIINTFGQILIQELISGTQSIDVSDLPEGMYVIQQIGEQSVSSKFIKK